MLCQRGELLVEKEEFLNTYKTKIVLSFFAYSPFEKGGRKGDLNFSQLSLSQGPRKSLNVHRDLYS
jgi:hypothetical protein